MFLAMFPGVLERLGASGERLGSVLERPGRLLGRLGAVSVAFKVVLDVKMSFESVQDTKSLKKHCFFRVVGRVSRRLGASWGVWGASWGRLGPSWGRLGGLQGRLGRQDAL